MNTKISPVMVVGKISPEELTLLTKTLRDQKILGKKEKILCLGSDIHPVRVAQRSKNEGVQFVIFSQIKSDMLIRYDIAIQGIKTTKENPLLYAFNVRGDYPKSNVVCYSCIESIIIVFTPPPVEIRLKEVAA